MNEELNTGSNLGTFKRDVPWWNVTVLISGKQNQSVIIFKCLSQYNSTFFDFDFFCVEHRIAMVMEPP